MNDSTPTGPTMLPGRVVDIVHAAALTADLPALPGVVLVIAAGVEVYDR